MQSGTAGIFGRQCEPFIMYAPVKIGRPPTDEDVAELCRTVRGRTLRLLSRRGLLETARAEEARLSPSKPGSVLLRRRRPWCEGTTSFELGDAAAGPDLLRGLGARREQDPRLAPRRLPRDRPPDATRGGRHHHDLVLDMLSLPRRPPRPASSALAPRGASRCRGHAPRRAGGARGADTMHDDPRTPLLRELQPGLWTHHGHKRFCGLRLYRWMTVVRLADGRLWVHSPNTPTPRLRAELEQLGEVAFVVAPNRFHSHAMADFAAAYPAAVYCGAPGLRARKPLLRIDRVLGDAPEPEWAAALDQAHLAGNPFMEEVLFLHRASDSLIVTDLIENIHREDVGLGWALGLRLFGLWRRPAPPPEHTLFTLDAAAFERSLARVRGWRFERILLAHGRPIERDARRTFDLVTERLLRRARRRGPLRRAGCRLAAWIEDALL
jgi:hypothetical protein